MGLSMAYEATKVDGALWLALAAAEAVTLYGWQASGGDWLEYDSVLVEADGVPIDPSRYAVDAFRSGYFREWMTAGPAVIVRYADIVRDQPGGEALIERAKAIIGYARDGYGSKWRVPPQRPTTTVSQPVPPAPIDPWVPGDLP
jgi:hypothetical protein